MRPLVRSYGDSSTRTRSPGSTRMRKRRILPARCPSTSCPLSSFTRNIRLGRASVISPSNSTFSSTAMQRHLLGAGKGSAGAARPAKSQARRWTGTASVQQPILVGVYPDATAWDQGDSLPLHLLADGARGAQLGALQDAPDDDAHLLQREARAEAAPGAAAEGQPRVGVGRAVAEEALGPKLLRAGVAVGAAVDHRDRRVDLHAVGEHVVAERERLAADDAPD